MKTYIAKLYKGGHIVKIDVQAKSQREAKQVAENICRTAYPDYKVYGTPKEKR